MFLAQSQRALEDGDLQRAFNLARKLLCWWMGWSRNRKSGN